MIQASFESRCSCDKEIREGDPIGLLDGEWVCEECIEDAGGEDEDDR